MKSQIYNIRSLYYVIFFCFTLIVNGCSKQNDWLDVKRNKSDVEPKTLSDLQGVLDNATNFMNVTPGLSMNGTDNISYLYSDWQALPAVNKNAFVWASDIFEGQTSNDWNTAYTTVEWSNIVLEGLQKIDASPANQLSYNNIKGSALFYRAKSFFELVTLFGKAYTSNSANTDLGIPLRLSADINIRSTRSTLQETYDQIINDLKSSASLLPVVPQYKSRPSKPAVEALLARVYLTMQDYTNAQLYASNTLSSNSSLVDFNTLPPGDFVLPAYGQNPEIIFWSRALGYNLLSSSSQAIVEPALYNSYDNNDLRKTVFFSSNGTYTYFHGTYNSTVGYLFSGLAVNEMLLTRAECFARAGNTVSALADLNMLLKKRWKNTVSYPQMTALNADDALQKILVERRKELPYTEPIRWMDLRRLNLDPQRAKTLVRNLNGTTYTLAPNDKKYVYPIPPDEIKISGLQQNLR